MKIIALEEHFISPEIMAAWTALAPGMQDVSIGKSMGGAIERRLYDLTDERIRFMDDTGIAVQVLSLGTPGVQSLAPEQSVPLAQQSNDLISQAINKMPLRLQGFATLPTPSPDKAAVELERAVCKLGLNGAMLYGRTGELNLDDPRFTPIFEAAAALRAPISLHPQTPLQTVRNAYYSDFDEQLNNLFAGAGIGWHYETGLQVIRLILSGIFDRLPNLQLILGHWGEIVLFFLDRIDLMSAAAKLQKPVSEYFKTNIYLIPSGLFSSRYLSWAKEVVGTERIMFATDYPYQVKQKEEVIEFLNNNNLNEQDRENIAHKNWERLCAAIKR